MNKLKSIKTLSLIGASVGIIAAGAIIPVVVTHAKRTTEKDRISKLAGSYTAADVTSYSKIVKNNALVRLVNVSETLKQIFINNFNQQAQIFANSPKQEDDILTFQEYLNKVCDSLKLDIFNFYLVKEQKSEILNSLLSRCSDHIEEATSLFNSSWDNLTSKYNLTNDANFIGLSNLQYIEYFESQIVPSFIRFSNSNYSDVTNNLKFLHFLDFWKTNVEVDPNARVDLMDFIGNYMDTGKCYYLSESNSLLSEFKRLFVIKEASTTATITNDDVGLSMVNYVNFDWDYISSHTFNDKSIVFDAQVMNWGGSKNEFALYSQPFFKNQKFNLTLDLKMVFFDNQNEASKYSFSNDYGDKCISQKVDMTIPFNMFTLPYLFLKMLGDSYIYFRGNSLSYEIESEDGSYYAPFGYDRTNRIRFLREELKVTEEISNDVNDPIKSYAGIFCFDNFSDKYNANSYKTYEADKTLNILTDFNDITSLYSFLYADKGNSALSNYIKANNVLDTSGDNILNDWTPFHPNDPYLPSYKIRKDKLQSLLSDFGLKISLVLKDSEIPKNFDSESGYYFQDGKLTTYAVSTLPFHISLNYLDNQSDVSPVMLDNWTAYSKTHIVSSYPVLPTSLELNEAIQITTEAVRNYNDIKGILAINVSKKTELVENFKQYVKYTIAITVVQAALTVASTAIAIAKIAQFDFVGVAAATTLVVAGVLSITINSINCAIQKAFLAYYESQLAWMEQNYTTVQKLVPLLDEYINANVFGKATAALKVKALCANYKEYLLLDKSKASKTCEEAVKWLKLISNANAVFKWAPNTDFKSDYLPVDIGTLTLNLYNLGESLAGTIGHKKIEDKSSIQTIKAMKTGWDVTTKIVSIVKNVNKALQATQGAAGKFIPIAEVAITAVQLGITITDTILDNFYWKS